MALSTHTTPPRPPAPPKPRPLARWEPLQELEELRARMDRVMEAFWRGESEEGDGADEAWIVKAELPGVRRDDVTIELRGGELSISAELDEEREREGTRQQRMRRAGYIEYRTDVPAEADADRIEAWFDDGVLTVRIPRSERAQPHRIQVRA